MYPIAVLCIIKLLWAPSAAQVQEDGGPMMLGAIQQQPVYCDETYQWMCANGECIAQYDVCDGISQCEDGSDEDNCDSRERIQPNRRPLTPVRPQQHQPIIPPSTKVPTNTTTQPVRTNAPNSLSLKVTALGLILLLAITAVLRYICKRRKANRNVRKGESLLDDEDDLLISQMYA